MKKKKYKCDICGREFNSLGFFKGHITGRHLNNSDEDIEKLRAMISKYGFKVFECVICGYRVLSQTPKNHFETHNIHINEENYSEYLRDITSSIEQPPIKPIDDQQEDEQQGNLQIEGAADDVDKTLPRDDDQRDHPVEHSEEDAIPISILDYTLLPDSNLTAVFNRDDGTTLKKVFAIGTVQAGDSVVISALVMGDNGILMPAFIIRGFSNVIEDNSKLIQAGIEGNKKVKETKEIKEKKEKKKEKEEPSIWKLSNLFKRKKEKKEKKELLLPKTMKEKIEGKERKEHKEHKEQKDLSEEILAEFSKLIEEHKKEKEETKEGL